MRSIVAAAVLAACSLRSRTAFADLPIPQVEGVTSTGFAYVGTVNPTTVPMSALPPIDLAPVVVTRTDGPGGAKDVEIHGGTLDVVHFGPGLSQLFTGTASMEAFMHAEIGSIHLLASADAASTPLDYQAPFPGALGDNPFFGDAVVSIGAGFVDVVTVPATKAAPNAGDLTTVTLNVVAECSSPIQVDDDSDLRGNIGGSLSLADGTDLGGVATTDPPGFSSSPGCPFGASRPLPNVPVLTPIALHFSLAVALSAKTGIDLQGRVHQGSYGVDHAFINLLNTGAVMLTNAEGAGATGSTGHDYGTLNGGPTISTTTSTTTTSTFIPPTTLPSCTGYCGDGIVQTDCAEVCECPTVDAMAVAVCAAATRHPRWSRTAPAAPDARSISRSVPPRPPPPSPARRRPRPLRASPRPPLPRPRRVRPRPPRRLAARPLAVSSTPLFTAGRVAGRRCRHTSRARSTGCST